MVGFFCVCITTTLKIGMVAAMNINTATEKKKSFNLIICHEETKIDYSRTGVPFGKKFLPDCYVHILTEMASTTIDHYVRKKKNRNNGTHSLEKCQNRHRDYE